MFGISAGGTAEANRHSTKDSQLDNMSHTENSRNSWRGFRLHVNKSRVDVSLTAQRG